MARARDERGAFVSKKGGGLVDVQVSGDDLAARIMADWHATQKDLEEELDKVGEVDWPKIARRPKGGGPPAPRHTLIARRDGPLSRSIGWLAFGDAGRSRARLEEYLPELREKLAERITRAISLKRGGR